MIKKLLAAAVLTTAAYSGIAQNFSLMYNFTAVMSGSASTGQVDPTPAPTAIGVTSGSWTAVGTSTSSSGGGYFSFSAWDLGATNGNNTTFTGSINPAKYYEITLTPQTGYQVTLNYMSFGSSRSSTGARNWAVRTNKDNFTANVAATYTALNSAASHSVPVITIQNGDTFFWTEDAQHTGSGAVGSVYNNISNVNFSGPNFTDQTTPYVIRVYAWNAEGAAGTFRMDTLVINGSASMPTGFGKLTHDLNAKFKLYPNPSSDGIVTVESLSSSATKVEVMNILGAVVAQSSLNEKAKLDLSSLPQGTYFVRVKAGDQSSVEKLIISK